MLRIFKHNILYYGMKTLEFSWNLIAISESQLNNLILHASQTLNYDINEILADYIFYRR